MTIVVNSPVAGIGFAGAGGVSLVYPTILAQSAIPFILAGGTGGAGTQFTISATGALSTLPTLPITSGNAFIYMPTGIPGLASGWYYALIQSATTAQLYTATYTSGDPRLAVPASPVAPTGITAGSYSQTTATDIAGPQIVLPGGSLGPNGGLEAGAFFYIANSANVKQVQMTLGGTVVWLNNTNTAGNVSNQVGIRIQNRNSQSSQVNAGPYSGGYTNFWGAASSAQTYTSINTSIDRTFAITLNIANAADFALVDMFGVTVKYGA